MEQRIIELVFEAKFLDVSRLEEIPLEGIAGFNNIFVANLRAGTIPDVKDPINFLRTFSTIQMLLDGMCELSRNSRRTFGVTNRKLET